MKYEKAKFEFQKALKHQKTIKISKLKTLMQSMNMSLKPSNALVIRQKEDIATIIKYRGNRYILDPNTKRSDKHVLHANKK